MRTSGGALRGKAGGPRPVSWTPCGDWHHVWGIVGQLVVRLGSGRRGRLVGHRPFVADGLVEESAGRLEVLGLHQMHRADAHQFDRRTAGQRELEVGAFGDVEQGGGTVDVAEDLLAPLGAGTGALAAPAAAGELAAFLLQGGVEGLGLHPRTMALSSARPTGFCAG